jgi:PadR family transcriptional regulator PadR
MKSDTAWPSEWLRGVTELCVLKIMSAGPTYGYAIASALGDAGLGTPKGGTLYPLLGRFEEAGWVTTEWRAGDGGPGRKFYSLTPAGRAALDERLPQWQAFTAAVGSLLSPATPSTPHPERTLS